jgi:selenocysteine-specific elongation factor
MRFTAYFIRFTHPQDGFQGSVQIGDKTVSASFRKVGPDLFAVHFKNQLELRFGQQVGLRNAKGLFTVLLPVLSQYNQRKLKKVAEVLRGIEARPLPETVTALLAIENFLELAGLLYFFTLERQQAIDMLTRLELAQRAKVINLNYLFVTSWEHFQESLAAMESFLRRAHEGRERTVKFAQLEKAVHVPQESVYFKYLLKKSSQGFPCRLQPGALVFSQLPLSAEEKARMAEVERVLRANHLAIFTFENIQKNTAYTLKQINDALWYMIDEGKLLQLDERHFMFSEEYGKAINRLKKFKRNQGDVITFDDLRSLTAYSRKYLIVLFEYWDGQNITRRVGNKRQILLGA